MRVIYNEGRVAGLSAYELYVRQQLADGKDPDSIPSEAEWIQTTTARGGSMILKIASGTTIGYHDYTLPVGTGLCACGPLQATLFEGTVETLAPGGIWATHIVDNGRLISNTNTLSPATPGAPSNVPTKTDPGVIPSAYRTQCVNYMRISSAIAIQPGEWVPREPMDGKLVKPDFSSPAFIRIGFSEAITADFYIMISGFLPISYVEETAVIEDPAQSYVNGEFIGPAVFPWASKVSMLITTDSLKGYLDWYLDATLTTAQYEALTTKENKFYFTRKQ